MIWFDDLGNIICINVSEDSFIVVQVFDDIISKFNYVITVGSQPLEYRAMYPVYEDMVQLLKEYKLKQSL